VLSIRRSQTGAPAMERWIETGIVSTLPVDLPVEQPLKFKLAVDFRYARHSGRHTTGAAGPLDPE
jgi:hypothetical protein